MMQIIANFKHQLFSHYLILQCATQPRPNTLWTHCATAPTLLYRIQTQKGRSRNKQGSAI